RTAAVELGSRVHVFVAERRRQRRVPTVFGEFRDRGAVVFLDQLAEGIIAVIDRQHKTSCAVVMLGLGQFIGGAIGVGPLLARTARRRVVLGQVSVVVVVVGPVGIRA